MSDTTYTALGEFKASEQSLRATRFTFNWAEASPEEATTKIKLPANGTDQATDYVAINFQGVVTSEVVTIRLEKTDDAHYVMMRINDIGSGTEIKVTQGLILYGEITSLALRNPSASEITAKIIIGGKD